MTDNVVTYDESLEGLVEQTYKAIVDAFVNSQNLPLEQFFQRVFTTAFDLIPDAEKGSYYELDGDVFVPVLSKGYDMEVLKRLAFTEEDMFIGFEVNEPGHIEVYEFYNKQRDDSKFSKEDIDTFKRLGTYNEFTSLYTPIQANGKNVGLLCFERFDGKSYPVRSKLILQLYAQLISNFLSERINREKELSRYKEIIDAMVSAIEVKDKYTEGHAQRVRELAEGLAAYMGMGEREIETVGTAAILHDIGKIGIPTEILLKPGKLTDEEYELVQEHPYHTKKILMNISDLSHVVDITYMHHEMYSGKGYPQGLKGDDIPIEAAIISIVDAYDAMTTDRSYRKALPIEKAIGIIKRERGQQFHPEVVDAFLKWQVKL